MKALAAVVGVVVLCAIVAVGATAARRIRRLFNGWRLERERKERTLVLTDSGIELRDALHGVRRWSLQWCDVEEIAAFKGDSFFVDDVCVGLRPLGSDRWFVCDEDMPGWD